MDLVSQRPCIVALGSPLPEPPTSFGPDQTWLQDWLLTILEEHRAQTVEDIKSHVLQKSLGGSEGSSRSKSAVQATTKPSRKVKQNQESVAASEENDGESQCLKNNEATREDRNADGEKDTAIESPTMSRRSLFSLVDKAASGLHNTGSSRSFGKSEMRRLCAGICSSICRTRHPLHAADGDQQKRMQHVSRTLFTNTASAVVSGKFDVVVGVLIIVNCIVMIVQLEYAGYLAQISMGANDVGSWPNADNWFHVIDHIFNGVFLCELIIRFSILRLKFFYEKSLIFDLVLVLSTSMQLYILEPMESSAQPNWTVFRLLRFVKFVRVFRLVRVLKMFSSLRILVRTIFSSFGALLWSMILLFLIMVIGGIFLTEMLKEFITDDTQTMTNRKWVFKYYGTSTRAMYTLFEVTLAGCWPEYFRPLIEHVSGAYVLFAVWYISVVVFAIIRIITAIFLKETLQVASNDAEMMVQERLKQKEAYVKKMQGVFKAVDISGDGRLSQEEFECIVQNPMVKTWLQILELEVHDAEALFKLLDDGDGEVTYEEFLHGVLRLKGQARTMDVVSILHQNDKLSKAVATLQFQVTEIQLQLHIEES